MCARGLAIESEWKSSARGSAGRIPIERTNPPSANVVGKPWQAGLQVSADQALHSLLSAGKARER